MNLSLSLGAAFLAGLLSFAPSARAQEKPAQEAPKPAPTQPATNSESTVYVIMKTTHGDVALELNREKAPLSVENFLSYTDKKFYDGTVFHRVIPNFMVQGGGFTEDMSQKKDTAKGIKNEWQNGLKNSKGTLAMARLGGQADSATCQFFINVNDNTFLDQPRDGAGYAVFGKVADGMDIVDKMKAVKTATRTTPQGPMQDVPTEVIKIKEMRRMTPEEVTALKAKLGKK